MPHKIINFNTAAPHLIAIVIRDYLLVNDTATLLSTGLTQSAIDDLARTLDRNPNIGEFMEAFMNEFIIPKKLYPPDDMDIPGDLYKCMVFQSQSSTYGGQLELKPRYPAYTLSGWEGGRLDGAYGPNTGAMRIGHPVKYNEVYSDPRTAPSWNRFLTLFDAYGGWQSYIMRHFLESLIGNIDSQTATELYVAADDGYRTLNTLLEDTAPGELEAALAKADTRIKDLYSLLVAWKLPYGTSRYPLFSAECKSGLIIAGVFAGHNYDKYYLTEEEIEQYRVSGYGQRLANKYADPSKLLVSPKLKNIPGDFGGDLEWINVSFRRPTLRYRKYGSWRSEHLHGASFHNTNPYSGDPVTFEYGLIPGLVAGYQGSYDSRTLIEDGYYVDLGPGTRRSIRLTAYEPVIEFPRVFDGSVYRPLEHPFGKLVINGDAQPAIDFLVEMAQHFEAIATWVEAGMPCDWPEWKDYLTPEQAALVAEREAAALEAATKYQPITTSSPTPPPAPREGDQWFDTTTGVTKVWREINPTRGYWVDA